MLGQLVSLYIFKCIENFHSIIMLFYCSVKILESVRQKERTIGLLKDLAPFCNHLLSFLFPKIQTKVTESIFCHFDVLAWPSALDLRGIDTGVILISLCGFIALQHGLKGESS